MSAPNVIYMFILCSKLTIAGSSPTILLIPEYIPAEGYLESLAWEMYIRIPVISWFSDLTLCFVAF